MTTTTTAMNDSFDRFGDDLAELLLQYLSIDDKLRLQSVSKQWLALIFTGQTHLVLDEKLFKRMSFEMTVKNVKKLKLFETIVKKCPNITKVNVRDINFFDGLLDLLIKYCNQLTHLSIKQKVTEVWPVVEPIFAEFIERFGQQLKTFKFDGNNQQFNRQLLYKVCDRLSHLKTVEITGNDDLFTDSHFRVNRLPIGLKSFNVKLSDKQSLTLFSKFADSYGQQIRTLNISVMCAMLSNNDNQSVVIGLLSKKMPQLRLFSLILLTKIDGQLMDKLLVAINKNLTQLRHMALICYTDDNGCGNQLTSDRLNRMHRLTLLTIFWNQSVINCDNFCRNIHRNLPRLQSLAISGMASISIATIVELVSLPHLSDLLIDGEPKQSTLNRPIIETNLLSNDRSKIRQLYIKYMDLFDGEVKVFMFGRKLC
ncbi:uncharacterized protein LOC128954403 isoform X1 [Oppia nitens]|uniref:uncharacterized protein LOC128954403 isoform X1 n=1 Tax=Oppia nitens TaxID=1686743 RepID=UPI0023DBF03F|nr:uncharacterized protein LOC128954403 isoform X1 [Oppia nitens]